MKTQEQEIAEHRERLKDRSDDQLLAVIHSRNSNATDHIAAQQLIDTRRTEREEARHNEIQKKLEELKKPHRPSFYILIFSAIFAFVAAIAAVLSVPQLQKAFFGNPQLQGREERLQTSEQPSQMPKKEQPKK